MGFVLISGNMRNSLLAEPADDVGNDLDIPDQLAREQENEDRVARFVEMRRKLEATESPKIMHTKNGKSSDRPFFWIVLHLILGVCLNLSE